MKPDLYLHVNEAKYFLGWELVEFKKYFNLVDTPSKSTILLAFGPDVLEEASKIPASFRFAVLFPGFRHNPVYNLENRKLHHSLIKKYYAKVFINPGPLEIAYKGLKNVEFYPFSIDVSKVKVRKFRRTLNSIIHVSSDSPQKDWPRSERIMKKTGLKFEVYPPRKDAFFDRVERVNKLKNKTRSLLGIKEKRYLPRGYVSHEQVIRKYQQYDAFIHVAKDIKDPNDGIDGKYTAALIEAGLTGSIVFWHDTYGLGNSLETVFELPLDEELAAKKILEVRATLNIREHSKKTHAEMMEKFNPVNSVKMRAEKILETVYNE